MRSFFGEVVFPQSRAVDLDYGDDFEEVVQSDYKVVLEPGMDTGTVLSKMKYLILACEVHSSNFAKVYLIPENPKPPVAFSLKVFHQIHKNQEGISDGSTSGVQPPVAVFQFFYVAGIDGLVGVTEYNRTPSGEWASLITDKIFDQLPAKDPKTVVQLLDFKPAAFFRSPNRASLENQLSTSGVFRYLKSTKQAVHNGISKLEVPNMVDGLSAAVLTHCELSGYQATLFVLYGPYSMDEIGSNILSYRTSLQRVDLWRDVFLKQENETVTRKKMQDLIRRSVPQSSVFG